MISDSKEQVDPSSDPRVDTNITDGIKNLSIRPITFEPVVIGQDLVTSVQETLRDGLSLKSLKTLHKIRSKDIVTDASYNSAQVDSIVLTHNRGIHRALGVKVEILFQAAVATPVSKNGRGPSSH